MATQHPDPTNSNDFLTVWAALNACARVLHAGLQAISTVAREEIGKLPRSVGYEPLLTNMGCDPALARVMATLAIRHGRRWASEGPWQRPVYEAIKFLAQKKRQTRALLPRATTLLRAWKETSVIETLFDNAGQHETEFIQLLQNLVDRRQVDCQRLTDIAAAVAPFAEPERGPKISAPSAAHQFCLEGPVGAFLKDRPRPRRRHVDEYVDVLTEATRREFGNSNFDSRPARRRAKAKKNSSVEHTNRT